jgi:peptide-methionine (S)-S-oxide reductase
MSSQASIWLRAAAVVAFGAPHGLAAAAEHAVRIPAPAFDEQLAATSTPATAVLAGGCFWGVQGVFQHVEGVLKAVSGYAGGAAANAKYDLVGAGDTGHAEAVHIVYDPTKITYGRLLQIFFSVVHDPTQLDKQGPDHGPQYRSAVFFENAQQRQIAEQYIAQLDAAKVYPRKIVTTLEQAAFYPAEAYHQDYLVRHPTQPYIVINDAPKVRDLAALFAAIYRPEPVLVTPRPTPRAAR